MPGHINTNPRSALITLKVVVVGGSIAGLGTAYALRKAGHEVTVLEKSDGTKKARLSASRGGLRSPPNMTRILEKWGLGPALDKYAGSCRQYCFQEGHTGDLIGYSRIHEEFLKELMANFLLIQHGHLHTMITDHAIQEGVKIRYNANVVNVSSKPVCVTLEGGERLSCDMIIGADGFASLVRSKIVGVEPPPPKKEKDITVVFTVPTSKMREHEDLRPLASSTDWSIWLGDGFLLHGSLVNSGRDYSLTLAYELPEENRKFEEHWSYEYRLEDFDLNMDKFEPRLKKLLSMVETCTTHLDFGKANVESLVCEQAKIVLVGEAAHPLLPSGQLHTALGIEDAQTLGSLFSGIQDRDQVPQLLQAYEDLRQARCHWAQDWERRKRRMLTLPRGGEQEIRDSNLRSTTTHEDSDEEDVDEDEFMKIWGDEMKMYAHDASEAVEDWWTKWEPVIVRAHPNRRSMGPSLEILKNDTILVT